MTPQELLEAGYTRSEETKAKDPVGKYCKAHFYRWIREGGKKLYMISVWEWRFPGKDVDFEGEARFYRGEKDHGGFTVELYAAEEKSVEQMQDFFADVYRALGCVPDIHNQD